MQQRNLLLFFVIVSLMLLVYVPLRQRLIPTPEPVEAPPPAAKADERKKPLPAAPLPGVDLPRPPAATPDNKLLSLGENDPDSKFNLRVVLDPLGGGVRQVTLNKFRPSTQDGRPAPEMGLDIVPQEATRYHPAHLLYHFDPRENDAGDPRPLDTLGRRTWEIVQNNGQAVRHDTTDDGHERQQVAFRTEADGVIITKTFTLVEGDYHIGLRVDLQRPKDAAKEPIKFRYQLTGAHGLPVEGKWYTSTFRNALIALEDDRGYIDREFEDLARLDFRSGGSAIIRQDNKFLRYAGVAVQYFASVLVVDENQANQKFLRRARATIETGVARGKVKGSPGGPVDSLVLQSDDGKTSTTIFLPPHLRETVGSLPDGTRIAAIYRPLAYDEQLKECPRVALDIRTGLDAQATHPLWENDITVRVATEPVSLAPGASASHSYLLYNGPVKPSLLRGLSGDRAVSDAVIDRYVDKLQLNTLTDYQSPGFMGRFSSFIGWSWLVIKCTNLMHWLLGKMTLVISSYGLAIFLLTLLVRSLMFPLSRKQAMMGIKMQALQPELKKLAEKHKDDRQAYAQAQMELFRQQGVNPIGSCWVLLLQMPIFMGLYFALQESIQFRLASFWPTWIVNLAAPDMLFFWGRSIPMLSRDADYGGMLYLGPYLNLLPLFAVALMIVQQQMMMPPPADKEQEMQQKMMRIMMVVMGLFFYKIAAGLCIYIITSTLWSFAERKLLPKAKPVGIDTNLDKRVAAAVNSAPGIEKSTAIAAPSALAANAKKANRSKRKNERGSKPGDEEPRTGLGRLRQRLSDWWNDVLEQARKK
ncbi:MAG: YidC/Oxa1 family insertase periplasmic-domain containing protein [Gemmataceae bacterium]